MSWRPVALACSRLASSMRAPTTRGKKSSSTAMSKERVVTARSASSGLRPRSLAHGEYEVCEWSVGDHDPLGLSGGSGGVDDVGEARGIELDGRRCGGFVLGDQ